MTSRKRSGKNINRFLVDTNLFITAIKMEKYTQIFESKRGKEILRKLIDKIEVMDVDEKFLRLNKSYFPKDELIDIYHAATCLQEGAVLITNDRHFDRINAEKIIEVWSINKAIEEFGI